MCNELFADGDNMEFVYDDRTCGNRAVELLHRLLFLERASKYRRINRMWYRFINDKSCGTLRKLHC